MINETMIAISTVFAAVFNMLITMIYLGILFKNKKHWVTLPVFLIFYCGVTALFFCLRPSGSLWIIYLALGILEIFIFTFLYEGLLISKIFAAVSLSVFAMISEVAAMGIILCSVKITRINMTPELMNLYGAFLSKPLKFLMILAVRLILKRNSVRANLKNFLCLFIIPLLSIFIIVALIIDTDNTAKLSSSSITAVLGVLIINFIVYYMLNSIIAANELREKQTMLEAQLVFQEQKYKQTSASFRSISGIIHDTNKHLLYLRECAVQGNNEEAVKYINTAISTLEKSYKRINTGHLVIDALVSNAYNIAEQNNIAFKTDIQIDKDRITIEHYDLSIVLGNLLDNAAEACMKSSSDNDRFISIGIFTSDTALVINVVNSIQYSSTSGFKSDKPDTAFHGYGLRNISTITEKYGGSFVAERNGSRFEATAILPFSL